MVLSQLSRFKRIPKKAAISDRRLEAVHVVSRLRDLGDIRNLNGFKKAWNSFLRFYNLMQFLPECLFVTSQGLQDDVYQPLEFVFATATGAQVAEEAGPQVDEYADLVDDEVLAVLRELASHGIQLPDPDAVPFELCGPHGNIIGQAELAWGDQQIAFVYEDDTESRLAFTQAGWMVCSVEALIAQPSELADKLKGGDR